MERVFYDRRTAGLYRALKRRKFTGRVTAVRWIDREPILRFNDGRMAFGSYDELMWYIKEATSVELLMAYCDLAELLSD